MYTPVPTTSRANPAAGAPLAAGLDEIVRMLHELKCGLDEVQRTLRSRQKSHYTVEEVARFTARAPYTVRRWIAEGRIKAIRVSGSGPKGRLLIARDQLDVLIGSALGGEIPDAAASC